MQDKMTLFIELELFAKLLNRLLLVKMLIITLPDCGGKAVIRVLDRVRNCENRALQPC
jgi:hypothetical protein